MKNIKHRIDADGSEEEQPPAEQGDITEEGAGESESREHSCAPVLIIFEPLAVYSISTNLVI
jgi:hypothetical protein